jgi:hypothetical protein
MRSAWATLFIIGEGIEDNGLLSWTDTTAGQAIGVKKNIRATRIWFDKAKTLLILLT